MKAFVTGGTGFIGSHLIDHLLNQKNAKIYALVRDPNNLKWLKGIDIHFLKGDLLSIPSLPDDIDYVFHVAGSTKTIKSGDYYTVNQRGTASLFQSLCSQNIFPKRVLFLSSLAVSGPSTNGEPVKEHSPPRPISPYGLSKHQAECEALKFKKKFPIVILRAGAVFGPRDRDFVSYFRLIKRGVLPSLFGKQRMISLCYVKDLVSAFDLCTQKDLQSGEIFHIADPRPYTWDELGLAAGHAFGKSLRRLKIPLSAVFVATLFSDFKSKITKTPSALNRHKFNEMKQKAWIADTTKAQVKLSFQPEFSLQRGVNETIDWYIERGWL